MTPRQELEHKLENAMSSRERDEIMKELIALNTPRAVQEEDLESDMCWGCGA